MMVLADRVHISRRFQRSIRIDTDLSDPKALEGFVCPKSSADVLGLMAHHVKETDHGAFTWTGPYGSGKSSLVIALSAALMGNAKQREAATDVLGSEITRTLWETLPPHTKGWRVLPIVARRDEPTKVIGEALQSWGETDLSNGPTNWTNKKLIAELEELANASAKTSGGLIVFIDEMGKFLEAAAHDNADVYIFQELAEAASRSKGRLIVVGILHQAFEEYAHRLSREARDEWSKIQGRFVDLAVNVAGEEQLDLLARAIEHDQGRLLPGQASNEVAKIIRQSRPGASERLADTLEDCWPLHPVAAALLGPISRRRFGQNQRSIFGFLNSAEPFGFQEFLDTASEDELYTPSMLWSYLQQNLEHSILASPDGHRWSMALEALERCQATDPDQIEIDVLKTVAIVDLFRERSGLTLSKKLISSSLPDVPTEKVATAIKRLQQKSLIVYRKFSASYAIFAGSDFDLEKAVEDASKDLEALDFPLLRRLANLQPILAKRHYHETGTMRWFEVTLAPLNDLASAISPFVAGNGTVGQFVLAIPTEREAEEYSSQKCRQTARLEDSWDVVVGLSPHCWAVVDIAKELRALEIVRDSSVELAGDAIARREVAARIAELQGQLETELSNAFSGATWFLKHRQPLPLQQAQLASLASDLADKRYPNTPLIHNELLNRAKPSGSAVAAQNALLRRMVDNQGEERLGIEGFPAEGGLFASLLEATGLYRKGKTGFGFALPTKDFDPAGLSPLWETAAQHLSSNDDRLVSVSELYDIWAKPPFGVKAGLMPVLAVAFALSMRNTLAFYRQSIFQPRLKDLDIDYLVKVASDIQFRWMDISDVSTQLLTGLRAVASDLSSDDRVDLEPINVARALISAFDSLPAWSKRTGRLSKNALHIRQLFKQANDPNKFLFDDLPALYDAELDISNRKDLAKVVANVKSGLSELRNAYPSMLADLRQALRTELQVSEVSEPAIRDLQERAENIRQIAGDFRLDAFIGRLATYSDTDTDIESLASLATNKPPNDWTDPDIDRAKLELSEMSRRFVRLETFAHVKGRENKRHALAVVLGLDKGANPILGEFDIAQRERGDVEAVIKKVKAALDASDVRNRNIILAALAELSAHYLDEPASGPSGKAKKLKAGKTKQTKGHAA